MLSFGGDDEDALRKALLIGGGVSLVASLAGAGYYVYNRWVYNPTVTGEVSTRFVQRPIWGEDGPGKEKRKKSSLWLTLRLTAGLVSKCTRAVVSVAILPVERNVRQEDVQARAPRAIVEICSEKLCEDYPSQAA